VVPTHSASVLVALAGTGGTPVNSSAGNATKLPPARNRVDRAAHGCGKKKKNCLL